MSVDKIITPLLNVVGFKAEIAPGFPQFTTSPGAAMARHNRDSRIPEYNSSTKTSPEPFGGFVTTYFEILKYSFTATTQCQFKPLELISSFQETVSINLALLVRNRSRHTRVSTPGTAVAIYVA